MKKMILRMKIKLFKNINMEPSGGVRMVEERSRDFEKRFWLSRGTR